MYQKVFRFFIAELLAVFMWKDPSNCANKYCCVCYFLLLSNKTHLNCVGSVPTIYSDWMFGKKRSPTTAIHMIICGIKWCKKLAPCSLCVGVPYFAFHCFSVHKQSWMCLGVCVCVCCIHDEIVHLRKWQRGHFIIIYL